MIRARLRAAAADERGFTLTELLVAMVLMVIVVGATLTIFNDAERLNRVSQQQNEAQDLARTAIDRMARELRNQATPTKELPVAVLKASPFDIVFIAVGTTKPAGSANARNLQRVRYCLNTTTGVLWSQTRTWTTAVPPTDVPDTASCPGGTGWTVNQILVDRVANGTRPLWTFGPAGVATLGEIRRVESAVWIDANPNARPAETRLGTTVLLRNQNRPPTASFIAKRAGDNSLLLFGGASTDPEGQSLFYKWTVDGVVTSCTTSNCDVKSTAGTKTVSLEVSDPSDLAATDTRPVP